MGSESIEGDYAAAASQARARQQCNARHVEAGRGSSMSEGATPYDIAHLAGGGH
jgi:hypothetical protein